MRNHDSLFLRVTVIHVTVYIKNNTKKEVSK